MTLNEFMKTCTTWPVVLTTDLRWPAVIFWASRHASPIWIDQQAKIAGECMFASEEEPDIEGWGEVQVHPVEQDYVNVALPNRGVRKSDND